MTIYIVLVIILLCLVALIYVVWGLQYRNILGGFTKVRVDELEGARKLGGRLRLKNLKKYPRSKSEAEVIKYLEDITGDKFPTAYPEWLVWKGKHLELDGFNGKNLALEFGGPWHTKWYPKDESYADYFKRITRDIVKRRLCNRHGVNLIVIDVALPAAHWRNYILSRLYDFGAIAEPPVKYIHEQVVAPFRNEQIEKELGLEEEFAAVNRL